MEAAQENEEASADKTAAKQCEEQKTEMAKTVITTVRDQDFHDKTVAGSKIDGKEKSRKTRKGATKEEKDDACDTAQEE